ncbi:hypothetical protein BJX61DRAFT_237155 [Aspergillus egyptiacus]|nr:hypothetical protein BJX61DRAFT_237155 [Aspergillus egyptiacus]
MERLSNEIVHLIGDHLDNIQDCYNAVLISRRFKPLFSRALYRSVALKNRRQVLLLVRAFTKRPRLASFVRSLDFHDWQRESLQLALNLTEEDIAIGTSCARTLSHTAEEHRTWVEHLTEGHEEPWMAFPLTFVNNLQELNLTYPYSSTSSEPYMDRIFKRAAKLEKPFNQRPVFQRLRAVSLTVMSMEDRGEDSDGMGTIDPDQVLAFFLLPSMRSFTVDSLTEYRPWRGEVYDDHEKERIPDGVSPIMEINCTKSNGGYGFRTLLPACAALKSFKYQHWDEAVAVDGFMPHEFYKTISRHKSTLETLWLDNLGLHYTITGAGDNDHYNDVFGSFADFSVLKDLRIRLPNLLDVQSGSDPWETLVDILPKTIETLYIEACREVALEMLVRQMLLVLQMRVDRFPAFRRLDIEGHFHGEEIEFVDWHGWEDVSGGIRASVYEKVEPLARVCGDAGVEFHLRDRYCEETMAE